MAERHAWNLWPHRLWPASAAEERALVATWRGLASSAADEPSRTAVTTLMVSLRCGATADDVTAIAPGIGPAELLRAYELLAARRSHAAKALTRFLANPERVRPTTVATASQLAPTIVERVVDAQRCGHSEAVAARALTKSAEMAEVVESVEAHLASIDRDDPSGVPIGQQLFDPYRPALWSAATFIPTRVGQLSPARVAALLGEDPDQ